MTGDCSPSMSSSPVRYPSSTKNTRPPGCKQSATSDQNDAKRSGGTCDSQNPKNTTGHQGDTVELSISKGPQTITIPDVVGENANQAKNQLEALGFKVKVSRPFGFGNTVQAQNPGAGKQAHKGDTVQLVVF